MRKIEIKSFVKLILFVATISLVMFTIGLGSNLGFNFRTIVFFLVVISFWGVILLGGILVNFIVNLCYKNKDDGLYYRDIPTLYTPAIASLIYDNTYESSLDVPATIISLIGKKIFSYDDKMNLQVIDKDAIDKLDNHEKYICSCITNNKKIYPIEFREIVIADAVDKKLVVRTTNKANRTLIFFFSILGLILLSLFFRSFNFYGLLIIVLYVILFIGVGVMGILDTNAQNNEYKNTPFGNSEKKKLIGLKHFLVDFSELEEKEEKYVLLWDDYLAYAYMFGINNKIFNKYMKDKKYQRLFSTEYDIIQKN